MIAALLALLALALHAPHAVEAPVVRAQGRPELPWVTVVVAFDAAPARAVLEARARDASASLADIGAAMRVEALDGHDVAVVDGPPEAHDAILQAARAVAQGARHVLFVDGRTPLVDTGALPARTPHARNKRGALAPAPGLVDVEGAALTLLVAGATGGEARIEDGALVLGAGTVGAAADVARAALEAAVSAPLPPRRVDELRTRARGVVAERRARAGGWARDMAIMWLGYGSLDVEEPRDLGSALRARVFPSVLLR